MPITFRIALRNLREHKTKTIIIVSLIALGMFLLVLGNSVIDTGKAGIEKSFVQSFSGHILVGPRNEDGLPVNMFGSGGFGPGANEVLSIQDWQEVSQWISEIPGVQSINPQITGTFQLELSDEWRAFGGFFGVDIDAYQTMFPDNLEIVEGRFLTPSDEGLVLPEATVKAIRETAGINIQVGDDVKVVGFGAGTKIKVLPLIGVVKFKTDNTSLDAFGFMDVSSNRYLRGMIVGAASQVEVPQSALDLLAVDLGNLDNFFGEETSVETVTTVDLAEEDLLGVLGDLSNREALTKADAGAWNYALLRLDDPNKVQATIKILEAGFAEKGWNLAAVDWEGAAGFLATFVSGAQTFFLILVIILSIVSVIIIMNTMIVSINERTAEIGTMRALGATKPYIRAVFLAETMALSILGGIIGLILAIITVLITNATGLPAPHPVFELVFGGSILYPVLSGSSVAGAAISMLLVGFLSSLYPTSMALRIQPIKAMQS